VENEIFFLSFLYWAYHNHFNSVLGNCIEFLKPGFWKAWSFSCSTLALLPNLCSDELFLHIFGIGSWITWYESLAGMDIFVIEIPFSPFYLFCSGIIAKPWALFYLCLPKNYQKVKPYCFRELNPLKLLYSFALPPLCILSIFHMCYIDILYSTFLPIFIHWHDSCKVWW